MTKLILFPKAAKKALALTVTHSKKHEVLTFSAKNLILENIFFEKISLQNFNFREKVPKMVNLAIFDNLKLVVKRDYQTGQF